MEVCSARKSRDFRRFAGKTANDTNAAERLGCVAVDFVAQLLEIAVNRANTSNPRAMAEPHHRKKHDRADEQSPIGERQDHEASRELNHRAKWVVEKREEEFARSACVFTYER